jgi:hypothetical protein
MHIRGQKHVILPNEPEGRQRAASPPANLAPNEPEPDPIRAADRGKTMPRPALPGTPRIPRVAWTL